MKKMLHTMRRPEVELFRCVLMFLIVLYHAYMHGIFGPEHSIARKTWWGFLCSSMLVWHVDGFVAISGWFGIRFSFKKLISF